MAEKNTTRIDKWLWSVRIFKTRALASKACVGGKVKMYGKTVKASRIVRPGDLIQSRKGVIKYEYEVLKITDKRIGAKIVPDYMHDITSKKELEKLKTAKINSTPKREKGDGRPTKKERRIIDKLQGKY